MLTDPENEIIISAVSFWEISFKSSLGKLQIRGFSSEDLPDICEKIGFSVKSLSARESCCYLKLKAAHHKDPFDRMLIWQAISNDNVLVTADRQIKKYASGGLKIYDGG